MNIFRYELKAQSKSTLIWSVSLIALLTIFLSLFTAIVEDKETFLKAMENYPEEMRNAMGMEIIENIASEMGFYAFSLTFTTLCAAIQAMHYGLAIISKEVRERTADFLMIKPISRIKLVTEKILAAFVMLIITNIFIITFAYVMLNLVKEDDFGFGTFMMLSSTILLVQLMFYAMGILLSVALPKVKSVLPISLGVVFGFYAISSFVATEADDFTRYFTPFKYFYPNYIFMDKKFELSYSLIAAIFVIISIVLSYIIFKKKDIHAV